MKIAYYIPFEAKPMSQIRTHGVSGSHTAAVGVMEHMARRCPHHEFVVCRSSIEGVDEFIPNLRYVDDLPPNDVDVLFVTNLDAFPFSRVGFTNLKQVVYVTHTAWTSNGYVLPEIDDIRIVYLSEWTKRHVMFNVPEGFRSILCDDKVVSSHVIGNPLIDDTLPDIDTINKIPYSFAYTAAWERGGEVALRAFKKIRDLFPERFATFHVASYFRDATQMARLKDEPNVTFHSSLGKRDLAKLMATTETLLYPLVLPNDVLHKDTFGCVVSEALACGVNVLTYRQGALEEHFGEWIKFVEIPDAAVQSTVSDLTMGPRIPWCNTEQAVDAFVARAIEPDPQFDFRRVAREVRERFSQERIGDRFMNSVCPILLKEKVEGIV
jgi:glycosyltransferase involved in cell wall biosynthesis